MTWVVNIKMAKIEELTTQQLSFPSRKAADYFVEEYNKALSHEAIYKMKFTVAREPFEDKS
jgi:hypothetical protein